MSRKNVSLSLLLMLSAAYADAQPIAVAAGYDSPVITLAPGQVVTIFVDGLNLPAGTDVRARAVPLPRQLAGVSATLVQSTTSLVPFENQAALFRVVTFNNCAGADPAQLCSQRAAVTLQVPVEATANSGPRHFVLFSDLIFSHNGVRGPGVRVGMIEPNVHLLYTCDSTSPEWPSAPTCDVALTNAEGELVGGGRILRARPGETIVAYAFGLGRTEPLVPTGEASPLPPAILQRLEDTLRVQFEFIGFDEQVTVKPAFVGLTPGSVGLYQIHVSVPQPPDGLPQCIEDVHFNTRLTVFPQHSLAPGDSVVLCIRSE